MKKKNAKLSDEWYCSLEKEKIVSIKTDEIFAKYGLICDRRESKTEQDRGIDFLLSGRKVDEKAAVSCIHFNLQTFVAEIYHWEHINKEGWFNNSISETDDYLFVYVRTTGELTAASDIWRYEGLIINAKLLKAYFSFFGDLVKDIKLFLDWDRLSKHKDFTYALYDGGKCDSAKLIFSKKFDAPAINLQLSKALLLEMSKEIFYWKKKNGKEVFIHKKQYAKIPKETIDRLKYCQAHYNEIIENIKKAFNSLPITNKLKKTP